jgi:hypothetical protein
LLLCPESIRSSSRKHGDYPDVVRQFCVPTPSQPAALLHRGICVLLAVNSLDNLMIDDGITGASGIEM